MLSDLPQKAENRLRLQLTSMSPPPRRPQMPNFTALDMSLPEVATLAAAIVQARDAVSRRSWSHPQEPTGEAWWADVLADPRARKRERRTDLAVKQAFYRLADEKREIILVACSKCDWRAAFSRDELIAFHGVACGSAPAKVSQATSSVGSPLR